MDRGRDVDALASDSVNVALRIERAGETITGQISIEDGPPSRFFGWLELIGRLDHETAARDRAVGEERPR